MSQVSSLRFGATSRKGKAKYSNQGGTKALLLDHTVETTLLDNPTIGSPLEAV